MSQGTESCRWCKRNLPEPGHDAWLIAEDRSGVPLPICTACVRKYKLVIKGIEKA